MGRFLYLFALCLVSCGGIAENSRYEQLRDDNQSGASSETADLPDCSGEFGEPEVLFEDPGWVSQALTPSADGLEFFYARLATDPALDSTGTRLPTLRRRETREDEFSEPLLLENLSVACEGARPGTSLSAFDLSLDGLRLYMGCSDYRRVSGASGPLLMFERSEPGATFELPPVVVGEVGISVGLTRDELTAYALSLDPAVNSIVRYERGSLSDPFGPGEALPGTIGFGNPEPSPDGTALWGVKTVPGTNVLGVAVSNWDEETRSFQEPILTLRVPPEGTSDVSPALAYDCRTVYFSRITRGDSPGSEVMTARR